MLRFVTRHFTALAIVAAVAGWALFYLPGTPAFAVFRLKQAIDARDGNRAADYVDFSRLVRHAGYEMVKEKAGGSGLLGEFVGKAAVDIFTKPIAQAVQSWAVEKVNDGDREVQMPAAAVAGSIIFLHRDGSAAWTDFRDHKGREWTIHMAREDDGQWRIIGIDDIDQVIEDYARKAKKDFATP
ncbi:MAG TPA: DUF2939 domain-containing protein [Candidatus Binataceae bacterium]|nr:DUF2939 domain-containing protein [Candidatus Binataceae bacterium]